MCMSICFGFEVPKCAEVPLSAKQQKPTVSYIGLHLLLLKRCHPIGPGDRVILWLAVGGDEWHDGSTTQVSASGADWQELRKTTRMCREFSVCFKVITHPSGFYSTHLSLPSPSLFHSTVIDFHHNRRVGVTKWAKCIFHL